MSVAVPEAVPWEKRADETARAFSNFALYRDFGPGRTLAKIAEAAGAGLSALQQQSAKYGWVERAEAYDAHVDRRMREARETRLEQLQKEEEGLAALLLTPVFARLHGRERENGRPAVAALDPNSLDASQVAQLATAGTKIRRLARGAPTELVGGAFKITSNDLQTIVRDVTEILFSFIPEHSRGRAEEELRAYYEGGRARR